MRLFLDNYYSLIINFEEDKSFDERLKNIMSDMSIDVENDVTKQFFGCIKEQPKELLEDILNIIKDKNICDKLNDDEVIIEMSKKIINELSNKIYITKKPYDISKHKPVEIKQIIS